MLIGEKDIEKERRRTMKLIKNLLISVIVGLTSTGLIFMPLVNMLEKLTENIRPEIVVQIGMAILFSLLLWVSYKIIKED